MKIAGYSAIGLALWAATGAVILFAGGMAIGWLFYQGFIKERR